MKYGNWKLLGGIVDGAVHIRQEKPCQDALFLQNGIACVADGHGSASCPYSDEGAKAAVEIAAEILAEMASDIVAHKDIRLPKLIETKWKEAVQAIHAEKGRELEPDEPFPYILYGTTLIAAAAAESLVFVLQIGDGNILLADKENARPILAVSDSIGEDTESLCLDEAWTYIRTQIIPWNTQSPAMLLLSTDGYAKSFADAAGFVKAGTDIYEIWQNEGIAYVEENLHGWLRTTSDNGSGDDIAMGLMFFC
ncbi:MAG: protein phosphatase 2C domain-containing protein [Defluviitaleaceae bacterium]|nr:protein phosphatase 2C domain-containing protein [Defluviitaleaceae bacterium]